MHLKLLVHESLGNNRFVVTNCSREDIPIGTAVNFLFIQTTKYVDGIFGEPQFTCKTAVRLKIVEISFWRKPHSCVPAGHHAGVRFEGESLSLLDKQIDDCPEGSYVFVSTETPDD